MLSQQGQYSVKYSDAIPFSLLWEILLKIQSPVLIVKPPCSAEGRQAQYAVSDLIANTGGRRFVRRINEVESLATDVSEIREEWSFYISFGHFI